MKKCPKCNVNKVLSDFAWKNKARDKYATNCKECHREYTKGHYYSNKEYYLLKGSKQRIRKSEYIRNFRDKPCTDCGQTFPYYMMEFDHRDPEDKKFSIARMNAYSWKQINDEIAKCDIVCANHHRERTHLRRLQADMAKLAYAQGLGPCLSG